ncbi:S8 family serine peptidase [Hoyosella subflava]|uniref:Putative serine protease n=1 Tax=Hoyosella subflava (strain DSM 45089 / JCM 17490 / NBRC 109087 / DQS3-9A1) TaxID=443218 RepID=F6EH50_HOYSD|nr:S8 family serine peptidase [Hoyosella subflava]AEF39887.1 Putative serine protease [Hoyosella subflava DQS3-9A1]
MRRTLLGALSASVLVGGLALIGAPMASADQNDAYIVVFNEQVNTHAKTVAVERTYGISSNRSYSHAIRGFSARMPSAVRERLAQDPDVAFIAPDRAVAAHIASVPLSEGASVPTGVRRIEAATATAVSPASDAAVAVIDTGIDLQNPDLNAVAGTDCTASGGTSQDANGHGTHVAGIIGARNSGSDTVGVAPNTRLYSVKVLDSDGVGTISQLICGIDWVTANAENLGIKVANVSLGTTGSNDNNCGRTNNDPLHLAICRSTERGTTYVVSAGNDRTSISGAIPAAYPEVLTVTAMSDSDGRPGRTGGRPSCATAESDDTPATFTNFARTSSAIAHTVAAPGVCISSTRVGGGVTTLSGSSMAAPHVTGVVALCLGSGGVAGPCGGLTPAQIGQSVRSHAATRPASYGFTGDPRNSPGSNYYGYLVHADVEPSPTTDPEPTPEPEPCRPMGSLGGC